MIVSHLASIGDRVVCRGVALRNVASRSCGCREEVDANRQHGVECGPGIGADWLGSGHDILAKAETGLSLRRAAAVRSLRARRAAFGVLALAAASLLQGCASRPAYIPYASGAASGVGYQDEYVDRDHLIIRVIERDRTSRKECEKIASRRASELALQRGAGFTVIEARFDDHLYLADSEHGSVRLIYSPGYDDWRRYWWFFRFSLGVPEQKVEPTWLLTDPDGRRYRRVVLTWLVRFGPRSKL